MRERTLAPFAVAPHEGLSVENPAGGILTFKAMAAASGGCLTAIDTVAAAGEGPPLHVHHEQDELISILEGRFRVRLADELVDAPAGTFVFIPRGTPHTWQNVGTGPGRFFAAIIPAATGFEEFFVRWAALPPDERDLDAFARLGRETQGLEVVGPPLDERAG
jgi:mannose-6-phosphate isomerase-like protein (cupin superfamily)